MLRSSLAVLLTAALLLLAPLAQASDLSAADATLLTAALAQLDKGEAGEARKLAAGAKDPLVADLVVFHDISRRGVPVTFEEVRRFLERRPDWPRAAGLALKAENVFPAGRPPAEVVAWFDRYPPRTGQGTYLYVDALMALGRGDDAKREAVRLWQSLPLADAQEGLFLGHYGQWLTPQDHILRLNMLLDAGLAGAAEKHAPRAGKGYPELAAARSALRDEKKNALKTLEAVPAGLRNDSGLLLDLARYYDKKGERGALQKLLSELGPANAGRPADFWQLRFKEARRLMGGSSAKTAYRIAAEHGLTQGLGFAELEWLAGYIALRQTEDPAAALRHFATYYEGSGSAISRGKAAYWAALAAEAQKKPEDARKWLITAAGNDSAFYGQLGAARLGLLPGENLPKMPAPDDATYRALLKTERARAIRALNAAGDWTRTAQFFDFVLRSGEGQAHFQAMGRLAVEMNRWDLVVDTGKAARNKGVVLIDYLFPVPPLKAIKQPEMALVLALIRQESEFDQYAVSRAGALGLMQLMPGTAQGVAKQVGLAYDEGRLTSDPDYNVRLGTTYLAGLLGDFNNSYILSLAGYNAGPSRARQWIERNGDPRHTAIDVVEWVEAIPFDETRNYVMRVTEGVVVYRHLLGETALESWAGYNPASAEADGARVPACCN